MTNPIEGLTIKETIELKIKFFEPFILTASRLGMERNIALGSAEDAWNKFIVKTPAETTKRKTWPCQFLSFSKRPSAMDRNKEVRTLP